MMAVVTERRNLGIVGFLKGVEGKWIYLFILTGHMFCGILLPLAVKMQMDS